MRKEAIAITNLDLTQKYNSYHRKLAFVEMPALPNQTNMCCSRAIVTCMAKQDMTKKDFKHFTSRKRWHLDKPDSQLGQARLLLSAVGLPEDRPIQVKELWKFEQHLQVQIIVVSGDVLNEISYRGLEDQPRKIFLYHANDHFTSIVNINALIPRKKLCTHCFTWYSAKTNLHTCDGRCGTCFRSGCIFDPSKAFKCPDCNMEVRSDDCMAAHKTVKAYHSGRNATKPGVRSACDTWYKCEKCTKVFNRVNRPVWQHICGEHYCRMCCSFQMDDHYCYYRIKRQKRISHKYLFFDYECYQDTSVPCSIEGQEYECNPQPGCQNCPIEGLCSSCRLCIHCKRSYCGAKHFHPNLIVCQTSCNVCENEEEWSEFSSCSECGDRCKECFKWNKDGMLEPLCNNNSCGRRQMIFHGNDANDRFCTWLFTDQHRGWHCLSHYGRGFDTNFILSHLVHNSVTPSITYNGTKIQKMHVPCGLNITFLDSNCFLPLKLSHLPKALDLDPGLSKGELCFFVVFILSCLTTFFTETFVRNFECDISIYCLYSRYLPLPVQHYGKQRSPFISST